MGLFDKVVKKECVESLPAKCTVTGGNFDILIERRNGKLMMLEGKKSDVEASYTTRISNSADKKSGMKSITVDGGLFTEKTYHCPICGNKYIVRCGKCHNITCYDGSGSFKCAHCGNSGKVSGTIQQIHVHDSKYKKPSANGDKSYYPGDKPYYPGDKPYYPGDK